MYTFNYINNRLNFRSLSITCALTAVLGLGACSLSTPNGNPVTPFSNNQQKQQDEKSTSTSNTELVAAQLMRTRELAEMMLNNGSTAEGTTVEVTSLATPTPAAAATGPTSTPSTPTPTPSLPPAAASNGPKAAPTPVPLVAIMAADLFEGCTLTHADTVDAGFTNHYDRLAGNAADTLKGCKTRQVSTSGTEKTNLNLHGTVKVDTSNAVVKNTVEGTEEFKLSFDSAPKVSTFIPHAGAVPGSRQAATGPRPPPVEKPKPTTKATKYTLTRTISLSLKSSTASTAAYRVAINISVAPDQGAGSSWTLTAEAADMSAKKVNGKWVVTSLSMSYGTFTYDSKTSTLAMPDPMTFAGDCMRPYTKFVFSSQDDDGAQVIITTNAAGMVDQTDPKKEDKADWRACGDEPFL